MLRELKNVRQIDGEGPRRWFADDEIELIIWYDHNRKLKGFQICYDKLAGTRTITWRVAKPGDGAAKSILVSDGPYNKSRLFTMVRNRTEGMDDALRSFILDRLESHGG